MYACEADYYCDDYCGGDDECFEECMNHYGIYEEDLDALFDDEYFDSCEDMCMELDDEDDYETCMYACDVDYYCDDYCGDDDECFEECMNDAGLYEEDLEDLFDLAQVKDDEYFDSCEDMCMELDDEDDYELCMFACEVDYYCDDYCGDDDECFEECMMTRVFTKKTSKTFSTSLRSRTTRTTITTRTTTPAKISAWIWMTKMTKRPA